MTGPGEHPSFTLGYVPGVTPGKWVRKWNERSPEVPLSLVQVPAAEAADMVRRRDADAVLLRLPTERTGLHAIPLYTETTVVVVPKDHLITTIEEVSGEDLADDVVLHPLDDTLDWEQPPGRPAIERPATTAAAIELVAAGVGLLVVPQSLARLHHRRDLTYRPVTDAPQSRVALSWLEDETTDLMEQFIGIVRGRTVNSTRGRQPAPAKRERPDAAGKKAEVRKSTGGNRRSSAARGGKRGKPRRRS
ncbi:LysR family transcriptional regulator substrate-binding protein [Saccharopolyspora sp. K220]|uniref:LysR family transcriptional regulator substrate-binding protein n=1 Tax=Saccharopolyspora soli TaxID=2926618 RepID=UPI001F55E428|nr:LysR family transcriptional regulator substrate-binding protein [Saccharopolyspora soli]MCI2422537.1 LysR family transcriptional regulator substrate-binding protein [Saccharopolyspora soli]